MSKRMTREEMDYEKVQMICNNCEASERIKGSDKLICHKMVEDDWYVNERGFCNSHSEKSFQELMTKAKESVFSRSHE